MLIHARGKREDADLKSRGGGRECRWLNEDYTTNKNKGRRQKKENVEKESEKGTGSGAVPDLWPAGN